MHRPILHRILSIFLGIALILSLAPAALASDALGAEIRMYTTDLGGGTSLVRAALWSNYYSDLRQEQYIVYAPNGAVSPIVSFGSSMTDTTALSASAEALETEGHRVVAAVNGDFFDTATGVPIGLVITDGRLRTSAPSYTYAIGFRQDGSAFIGKPNLSVTAQIGGQTVPVATVNKVRGNTGVSLFTPDFSSTTRNTSAGLDIILLPQDGSDGLSVGQTLTATVEQIFESAGPLPIEDGRMVLSLNASDSSGALSLMRALKVGDAVTVSVSAENPVWNEATSAIGALYKLVTNGETVLNTDAAQAPRTAVGLRSDGSVLFYTVDGRQARYSIGATLNQVAERLVELDCVDAICLDGGGSTTIGGTMPASQSFTVTNHPSDGSERAVSNAIFLVSPNVSAGAAAALSLPQNGMLMLSGATVALSASAVDSHMAAVALPDSLHFYATGTGTVSGTVFTAGPGGTARITAQSGQLSGNAQITVIQTPDQISVRDQTTGLPLTELTLAPGDTVDLTASAAYRNLSLVAQDACFAWQLDGSVGTVTQEGVFTAGPARSGGALTVRAGGCSARIPIKVDTTVHTLEDFEEDFSAAIGDGDSVSASAETRADRVRRGYQSLRVGYDLTTAGRAVLPGAISLPYAAGYFAAWVYGDGSANGLHLISSDGSGAETLTSLGTLDFTGWRRLTAELPSGARNFCGFELQAAGRVSAGTLWFDHITAANGAFSDETAPVIVASRETVHYSATLTDNIDGVPAEPHISLTRDGQPLSFSYDAASGALSAILPEPDGQTHLVTLTARDRSGNTARSTLELAGTSSVITVLSDLPGHWAEPYATYLYDQGIITGTLRSDQIIYQPDKAMTRSEFAVIMARWLKLDTSLYADVSLPFDDLSSIAEWALPAARALYALGIIQGSSDNGRLLFKPTGTISRAEAMTIIGRTMEQGYAAPPLPYQDAGSVADWALPYAQVLSGLSVVSGYQNNLMPGGELTKGAVAKILYLLS